MQALRRPVRGIAGGRPGHAPVPRRPRAGLSGRKPCVRAG